jgi:hypothetical protein
MEKAASAVVDKQQAGCPQAGSLWTGIEIYLIAGVAAAAAAVVGVMGELSFATVVGYPRLRQPTSAHSSGLK